MRKIIFVSFVVLLAFAGILINYFMKGPDLSQYESLKEPRITTMQNQKMLVVEAKGDPNVSGSKAFGLLFKTYFKLEGTSKGPKQPAPRARWPISLDSAKTEWIGYYAMPIPDQISALPDINPEAGLKAELTVWEYGEVAEILHIGPYNAEAPTVEKLKKFIDDSGYKIAGLHEEEYLKGPGMFFMGNPEKYYTIIRYRVEKKQ